MKKKRANYKKVHMITGSEETAKELEKIESELKKGESWRKGYMRGIKEKEQEAIILRSDIHRAIGHMQGCGHPDKYLEKKYPLSGCKSVERESEENTSDGVCGCTNNTFDCFDCANDRHYACTGLSRAE